MNHIAKACLLVLALSLPLVEAIAAGSSTSNTPALVNSDGCRASITAPDWVCVGETFTAHVSITLETGTAHNVNYPVSIEGSTGATVTPTVITTCPAEVDPTCFSGSGSQGEVLTIKVSAASKAVCLIVPVPEPISAEAVTFTRTSVGTSGNFGLTVPNFADFDIGTYTDCPAKKWRVKITKADCEIGVGIDMLGRAEASVAAATAANWRRMSDDIAPTEAAL